MLLCCVYRTWGPLKPFVQNCCVAARQVSKAHTVILRGLQLSLMLRLPTAYAVAAH